MTIAKVRAIKQDILDSYKNWRIAEMQCVTIDEVRAVRAEISKSKRKAKRREAKRLWREEVKAGGWIL